jgi:sulfate adenylyltransferase
VEVAGVQAPPAEPLTLRAEVLQVVRECATTYGFGSPLVTAQYLRQRTPVMSMPAMDGREP